MVSEITSAGGQAIAVQGNVSLSADVKRLFAETKNAFGKLDILVNNAGVFKFAPLEAVTEEEFHRQFNINVLGTILATQEALQHFNGDGGSVINVSSVVSDSTMANSVVYAATKGAVDTIAGVLSKEFAGKKIRVNTIAPGGVETEGAHTEGIIGSDIEKHIIAGTPLGRIGQPSDVAKVAVFLASDDAEWVNGERISVAGGFR
ncbi:MAG: SDR family oxidoreductase [Ferruginibacter sp.]